MTKCSKCKREALLHCNCGKKFCFEHGAEHIQEYQSHATDVIKGKLKKFNRHMNAVVGDRRDLERL